VPPLVDTARLVSARPRDRPQEEEPQEEEAVEEVDNAAAAAPPSRDKPDPQDLPDPQEAMASPVDLEIPDPTLSQHHSRHRVSHARAAASQPATAHPAHQGPPARTATQVDPDRTPRVADRALQDPQGHPDPMDSQEAQASQADQEDPVRCTRLPAERAHPAHQAQMVSLEAQGAQETMDSQEAQDSRAPPETLEPPARPATLVDPARPEAMVREEARVAATTAHHPARPQATKQQLGRGSQSNRDDSSTVDNHVLPHYHKITANYSSTQCQMHIEKERK